MKAAQERRTPKRVALSNAHLNSRQRLGVRRSCAALVGSLRNPQSLQKLRRALASSRWRRETSTRGRQPPFSPCSADCASLTSDYYDDSE